MWLQHFISSFINEESFSQALSSHQFLSKLKEIVPLLVI